MYAIVRCGGRQEKVALDDVLTVDKLADEEAGSSVTFPALLVVDDGTVISDAAELSKYEVSCTDRDQVWPSGEVVMTATPAATHRPSP